MPRLDLDVWCLNRSDDQRRELVTWLHTWMAEGHLAEPRETGVYLGRVLDEERLADRKLFPPELKDVTWWPSGAARCGPTGHRNQPQTFAAKRCLCTMATGFGDTWDACHCT